MKILNSIYVKIMSWILVLSFTFVFIFSDYAYAREYVKKTDLIDIPFEYGQVVDRYNPGITYPRIILIQDLHANYEVQKNIKGILNHLTKNHRISKIGLEGSPNNAEIDVSLISTIPDEKRKKEAADFFMKNGMVKGAEAFAALKEDSPPLVGIEDEELYENNSKLLLSSLNHRPQIVEYLQKIKYLLNMVEDRVCSAKLKKFRTHYILYKQNKLSSYTFQKYLKQWAREIGRTIQDISREYSKYTLLTERRYNLDNAKIEKEYIKLLEAVNYMDYEDESRLTATYRRFKNFFRAPESVRDKMTRTIYSDQGYSNLREYIESVEISKEINTLRLLKEEKKVIETVSYGLCKNEAEKDLLSVLDYIQLLVKFLLNQVTRDELDEFYGNTQEFENKFSALISSHQKEILAIESYLVALKPYIEEMGSFYNLACRRDEEFIKNFVEKASRRDKNLIIVTGGFHTEGIAKKLKEKKVRYTVIAPRVTSHTEEEIKTYYTLLRGMQPLSYEEILGETLALKSFFNERWFLKLVVLKVLGLSEIEIASRRYKFITGWAEKYDKEKKMDFYFNAVDVIVHKGELIVFLNLDGKPLAIGAKDGRTRVIPQEQAGIIAERVFQRTAQKRANLIRKAPEEFTEDNAKLTLAGKNPLCEIGKLESGRKDAIERWLKNFNEQKGTGLTLVEVEGKSYVYDRNAVRMKLASTRFSDWDGVEENIEAYLTGLILEDDWRVDILRGYDEREVVDARMGIEFVMPGEGKQSVTRTEGRKLSGATDKNANRWLNEMLAGRVTVASEEDWERGLKAGFGSIVAGFVSKYKYLFFGIGITAVAVVAAFVLAPVPALAGWAGSIALIFLLDRAAKRSLPSDAPAAAKADAGKHMSAEEGTLAQIKENEKQSAGSFESAMRTKPSPAEVGAEPQKMAAILKGTVKTAAITGVLLAIMMGLGPKNGAAPSEVFAMDAAKQAVVRVIRSVKIAPMTEEYFRIQQWVTDHIHDNNYTGAVAQLIASTILAQEPDCSRIVALGLASEKIARALNTNEENLEYAVAWDQIPEGVKDEERYSHVYIEFTKAGVLYSAVIDKQGNIIINPAQMSVADHVARILNDSYSLENRLVSANSLIKLAETDLQARTAIKTQKDDIITAMKSELSERTDEDEKDGLFAEFLNNQVNELLADLESVQVDLITLDGLEIPAINIPQAGIDFIKGVISNIPVSHLEGLTCFEYVTEFPEGTRHPWGMYVPETDRILLIEGFHELGEVENIGRKYTPEEMLDHEIGHRVMNQKLVTEEEKSRIADNYSASSPFDPAAEYFKMSGPKVQEAIKHFVSEQAMLNENEYSAETYRGYKGNTGLLIEKASVSQYLKDTTLRIARLFLDGDNLKVYSKPNVYRNVKVNLVDGKLTWDNLSQAVTLSEETPVEIAKVEPPVVTKADASKHIASEDELESYEKVSEKNPKDLDLVEHARYTAELAKKRQEIETALVSLGISKAQRDKILGRFDELLETVNISRVDEITGAEAVHDGKQNIILDNSADVSTVLHEIMEIALKDAGVEHAHMYAFMVETEVYSESVVRKLRNYDDEHLARIIEGTDAEIEAIRSLGLPADIEARKIANAQKVRDIAIRRQKEMAETSLAAADTAKQQEAVREQILAKLEQLGLDVKDELITSALQRMTPEQVTGFRDQIFSIIEAIQKRSNSTGLKKAVLLKLFELYSEDKPAFNKLFNALQTVFSNNKLNPYVYDLIEKILYIKGAENTLIAVADKINETGATNERISGFFNEMEVLNNLIKAGGNVLASNMTFFDEAGRPVLEIDAILEFNGKLYIVESKNVSSQALKISRYLFRGKKSKIQKIENMLASKRQLDALGRYIGTGNANKLVGQKINILLAVNTGLALRTLNNEERSLSEIGRTVREGNKLKKRSLISRLYHDMPAALIWLRDMLGEDIINGAIKDWLAKSSNKSPPDPAILEVPEDLKLKNAYEFSFFIGPDFDAFAPYDSNLVSRNIIEKDDILALSRPAVAEPAVAKAEQAVPDALLMRNSGEKKLVRIFKEVSRKGHLALCDLDGSDDLFRLYSREVAEFIIHQYIREMHKMAAKHGGFAYLWEGDEAVIYLPDEMSHAEAVRALEQIRTHIVNRLRGKYGTALIKREALSEDDIRELKKRAEDPAFTKILAVGEFGDHYQVVFQVEDQRKEAMEKINKMLGLELKLDKENNGWLAIPTVSIGAVDLSNIPESEVAGLEAEEYLETVQTYIARAEKEANEIKDILVCKVIEVPLAEIPVMEQEQIDARMKVPTIPGQDEAAEQISKWQKEGEVTVVRLHPYYNGEGLDEKYKSEKKDGWKGLKAVNTRYGLFNGDKLIGHIFGRVNDVLKNKGLEAYVSRAFPDEPVIVIKGKVPDMDLMILIMTIRDAINKEGIEVDVGFDAISMAAESDGADVLQNISEMRSIIEPADNVVKPVVSDDTGDTRLFAIKPDMQPRIAKKYRALQKEGRAQAFINIAEARLARLGISEVRKGLMTSFRNGILTVSEKVYNKITEISNFADPGIYIGILKAMVTFENTKNKQEEELLEDYLKGMKSYTNIRAIALPLWFNKVLGHKIDLKKMREEDIRKLLIKPAAYRKNPERAQMIIDEVKRIEMRFSGQRRVVRPAPSGMTEPEKKNVLQVLAGLRGLVDIIIRLGRAAPGTFLELTSVLNPFSASRRWDGLLAAFVGEDTGISMEYIMERLKDMMDSRRPEDRIIPRLNDIIAVFMAT